MINAHQYSDLRSCHRVILVGRRTLGLEATLRSGTFSLLVRLIPGGRIAGLQTVRPVYAHDYSQLLDLCC